MENTPEDDDTYIKKPDLKEEWKKIIEALPPLLQSTMEKSSIRGIDIKTATARTVNTGKIEEIMEWIIYYHNKENQQTQETQTAENRYNLRDYRIISKQKAYGNLRKFPTIWAAQGHEELWYFIEEKNKKIDVSSYKIYDKIDGKIDEMMCKSSYPYILFFLKMGGLKTALLQEGEMLGYNGLDIINQPLGCWSVVFNPLGF